MNTSDITAVLVIIAVVVLGVALTIAQAVRNRRSTPATHPPLSSASESLTLYVLTNTAGQICHLEGRPVITSGLDEARYLQAGLMEHGTMAVISVYIPERVL